MRESERRRGLRGRKWERVRAQKKDESKKWREEVKRSIKDERRGEKIPDEREAKR